MHGARITASPYAFLTNIKCHFFFIPIVKPMKP